MKTQKTTNNLKFNSMWTLFRLVLIGLLSITPMSPAGGDTWTKKNDMPTARGWLPPSSPVVDGKICVIGGAYGYTIYRTVQVYDPVTDTWMQKSDMPTARWGLCTSAVNGKIYAIGGEQGVSGPACSIVEEYDPATDTWTRKVDMPTRRVGFATCVVDGKIYAIGGGPAEPFDTGLATVEVYDPVRDTWARRADMPTARAYLSADAVGGKIYAMGGTYVSPWSGLSTVEIYDPAADTWTTKAPMPTGRWALSTCVIEGRIYAIGGTRSPGTGGDASVEAYEPATDAWTQETAMATRRLTLSTSVVDARIYAIGGITVPYPWMTSIPTVEVCDLNPPPPDFNGDEIVDFKDFSILVHYWSQEELSVDIAPPPFGDRMVDFKDLTVLAEHWLEGAGPIAHWKLDETEGGVAHDSAGDHNGSVLVQNPLWRRTGGRIGGALEFDGIDDSVSVPFVLNPAEGAFSVFAWVKGGGAGQVILSQAGGANWLMAGAPDGILTTEIREPGRKGKPLVSQAIITDGAWHRVGFTWDGSHHRLYVDDVLAAEDAQGNLAGSSANLIIGAGSTLAPGTFWSGLIDDVRLYDRAVKP